MQGKNLPAGECPDLSPFFRLRSVKIHVALLVYCSMMFITPITPVASRSCEQANSFRPLSTLRSC